MPEHARGISRRQFIESGLTAGAGLLLAVDLGASANVRDKSAALAPKLLDPLGPSTFVQVAPDGTVTIWITKSEMGQGVRTSLAMVLADELDADWSRVQVRSADYDPKYPDMETGGSTSVSSLWTPLRTAGAQAREMLVLAAARQWSVPSSECRAEKGRVVHQASGRSLGYGDLSVAASMLPVPESPKLKSASEYSLIGTAVSSLDGPDRVTGRAAFGIDTVIPGLRYAAIARPAVLGAPVAGYDAAAAKAVPGVIGVYPVKAGVAVVATSTWAAFKGAEALLLKSGDSPQSGVNSTAINTMLRDKAAGDGVVVFEQGDAPGTLAQAARTVTASYEVPFLAHAPMEPMNCTARMSGGKCEVWAPTQVPGDTAKSVADRLGIEKADVTVHVTLLGGGFGRRLIADYAAEAAEIAMAAGVPVKLTWSREDDMRHGRFRPAGVNRLAAGLDPAGRAVVWTHRVATPSISESLSPGSVKDGLDAFAADGAGGLPYTIPHIRIEYAMAQSPVPVLWWRSVYASQNVFAAECFVDEVAHAAGKDPIEFRRSLLKEGSRERAVLEMVAKQAGWGHPQAGRFQGIALHHFFSDTIVAEVAEVSVNDGFVSVHRVVCAVDCGTVVNPDGAKAQITGGVLFGLSAALHGAITIDLGQILQTNFDTYRVLRMPEAPVVEVHFVPSDAPPLGLGEPAVPPIAPAVANAVFAATGVRVRKLPIVL